MTNIAPAKIEVFRTTGRYWAATCLTCSLTLGVWERKKDAETAGERHAEMCEKEG